MAHTSTKGICDACGGGSFALKKTRRGYICPCCINQTAKAATAVNSTRDEREGAETAAGR